MPLLAGMLVGVAAASGAAPEDAADIGRIQGRAAAARLAALVEDDDSDLAAACLDALVADLTRVGFDPAVVSDDGGATVAFTHCPFYELAEAHPEIVCHLHRGMVEGLVTAIGGLEVAAFGTLVDRQPCQVELAAAVPGGGEGEP
jgi:predicted ArsR family transcriptional regulator